MVRKNIFRWILANYLMRLSMISRAKHDNQIKPRLITLTNVGIVHDVLFYHGTINVKDLKYFVQKPWCFPCFKQQLLRFANVLSTCWKFSKKIHQNNFCVVSCHYRQHKFTAPKVIFNVMLQGNDIYLNRYKR